MYIDYKIYIDSKEWIERRNRHILRNPVCRACGSDEKITVHHASYARL